MKKRILLVDDHKLVRDALKFYFENDQKYEISDEAVNGLEALEFLSNNNYDLLITDINMPQMNGLALIKTLREQKINIGILVLSMFDDIQSIKKMLALQVDGYILKDTGKKSLTQALDTILSGDNYFAPEISQRVMESMNGSNLKPTKRLTLDTELSNREKEVLKLILAEKSNQAIADALFISVRTVEGYKRNMLIKTGCKNLVGLTKYAIENNLV
ncbi:MAG: response regulator transcription factor [Marinoscillum sp.]